MALLMHRRGDGGILVHLHEIFPRIYRPEVLRLDHRGDDRQLRLSLPGHQGAPAGDRLRHLDRNRRPGGPDRRHHSVQGTGRPRPALLRRPAPGGYPGPEGHVRTLSGPLPSPAPHKRLHSRPKLWPAAPAGAAQRRLSARKWAAEPTKKDICKADAFFVEGTVKMDILDGRDHCRRTTKPAFWPAARVRRTSVLPQAKPRRRGGSAAPSIEIPKGGAGLRPAESTKKDTTYVVSFFVASHDNLDIFNH